MGTRTGTNNCDVADDSEQVTNMVHGKTRQNPGQPDLKSRDKSSVGADSAGAFGKRDAEVRSDSQSGLSADKGVMDVGDPAMPTGTGKGLVRGERSEIDVMAGRDRTIGEQLREKGYADSEQQDAVGEPEEPDAEP